MKRFVPASGARWRLLLLGLVLWAAAPPAGARPPGEDITDQFLILVAANDTGAQERALAAIRRGWDDDMTPMAIEALSFVRDPVTLQGLIELLEQKTNAGYGYDPNRWYEWLWKRPASRHPRYAHFKAELYGLIDPRFSTYFGAGRAATIRLDEVRWGGVRQDGIPPLRDPKMIVAAQADYLRDGHVVFGIEVNGDARAYPKRIMGWHEMFVDTVGDVPVAGVYCTLCGTMILYQTEHKGVNHRLGTSGFLYRSNKLMYDQATQSLWSTFEGRPVIGPLVGQNIVLERLSIVTTTWGEWRRRHPGTRVLSLNTGYRRDYAEGAAYREYFATDELMFNVPQLDKRLKNKDEVLGLVFNRHPDKPLAISARYLSTHPVHHDRVGDLRFVVLTDSSGANRVYETKDVRFRSWDGDRTAVDTRGTTWTLSENRLTSADGRGLHRLPAQRAFWFGWYSAYSHTRLVR
ncbi:MAG: DUF3179 domain-containing protein [Gammaproteobacteria bacterium]|nr:DUF3179 domain-containing protein [Gammaproteobacteria bacterium]